MPAAKDGGGDMSAARDLLDELAVIGATIEPAGDHLILRAGATAIPAPLVRRVRWAKTDLLSILAVQSDRARQGCDEEQERAGKLPTQQITRRRTIEACIIDWLNLHPAPSAAGCCRWCGKPETPSAMVLPFGAGEHHAWVHAECWLPWHQSRRVEAAMALRKMGPSGF
jgi:hypothetical protein